MTDHRVARFRPSHPAALIASLILGLLLPATASAHAELTATTPADGVVVVGDPTELSATFSEALSATSTLSLRNASGERLAVGGPDPADARRLVIDPIPALGPGTYEMRWTALSDDGHVERGTWSFEVSAAEPTATATPAATARPTAAPDTSSPPTAPTTAEPSPVPAPDDPSPTTGDVLLPIVVALLVVAVGGALMLGRRGRPGQPR
jgi:methionine-rich copper-binding protein CopC